MNLPCVGHTLQLAVKQCFDLPRVSRVLARVKRLVLHFHKSPKATYKLREKQQLLGLKQESLKNDCVTRWGSTRKMLASLLRQQQAVCAVLLDSEKRSDRDLMLTSQEFLVAEELLAILEPFNDATEVVSGEKYPTIGIVLPVLLKFLHKTLKFSEDDSPIVREIKNAIKSNLENRYQDSEVKKTLRLATYLDPCFKALSFLNEADRIEVRQQVKDALVELIKSVDQSEPESPDPSTTPGVDTPPKQKRKLELLLEDIFEVNAQDAASESDKAERELSTYASEEPISLHEQDPLLWWKSRTHVYKYTTKLVKRTLCITATSVSRKRLFSAAGELVSSKRSSLKPKNINMLLFFCTRTALINLVFGCFSFFFLPITYHLFVFFLYQFLLNISIYCNNYISTNISIL